MPQFGLRGIKVAKYVNTNGVISYTDRQEVGKAMQANFELRRAEARLYAEDGLAEYMTSAVGGTVSLGVAYIKDAAQKLMFGLTEKTRSVTPTGNSKRLAGTNVPTVNDAGTVPAQTNVPVASVLRADAPRK